MALPINTTLDSERIAAITRERDEARADAARLREALTEIGRPKFGGLEPSTTTEDALEYWSEACERERMTARVALADTSDSSPVFACGRCAECDGGRGSDFCVAPRGGHPRRGDK